MIKHEGSKWVLYSSDGKKKLGSHDTKAKAEAQERAIYANKLKKILKDLTGLGKKLGGWLDRAP